MGDVRAQRALAALDCPAQVHRGLPPTSWPKPCRGGMSPSSCRVTSELSTVTWCELGRSFLNINFSSI